MGAAASSLSRPSQITSGKDLVAKTKDVREMSNALFTFMYSVWEEREVWDIANRPGDYVIALSDMIHTQFHVLGYTTAKNKVGEIYFMRYDKMKPPSEEGNKGIIKQRENAKIIAFYFIRIFQILGAMLLVVKDISFPVVDSKTGVITNSAKPGEPYRPYTNQQSQVLARHRPIQTAGGSALFPKDLPLGPYEFLRYYLRQISDSEVSEYQTKYNITLDKRKLYILTPNLFFEYNIGTSPSSITKDFPRQNFYLLVYTQSKRGELKVQGVGISNLYPSSLPGYLPPSSPSFTSGSQQLARYPTNVTFDFKIGSKAPQSSTVTRTVTEAKEEKYENGVEYAFDSGNLVDLLLAQYDSKKDFKKILELLVLFAIRSSANDKSIQMYRIKTEENTGFKQREIGKMPSAITSPTIDEFYQVLLNRKGTHQPHCISRALQIIDTKTIEDYLPTSGKSGICKFAVGDKAGPIDMATYKPLKSVAQLFGKINPANFNESQMVLGAFVGREATKDPVDVKKLTEAGQKDEAQDLSIALKKLAAAFQYTQEQPIESFSQIKLSKPGECKTSGEMEIKNQQVTLQLQTTARRLLAYHVNHTIEISKFLKTIFNIVSNPNGSLKVEGPKTEILFAGFPILNQITDQARDLLVDYYSGCEEVYQVGIRAWKQGEADLATTAPNLTKGAQSGPPLPSRPGQSNQNNPGAPSRVANVKSNDPKV